MTKVIKYVGVALAVLVGIIFISMLFSGEAQNSFQKGMDAGRNTVESVE